MKTDIGEYIVGAHLLLIKKCDVVSYNVRPPEDGLAGLTELDVIGLDFKNRIAYLCEVTTHTRGILYGTYPAKTLLRIEAKHERQKLYAKKYLSDFTKKHFMFWSPVVPRGLIQALIPMKKLEVVANKDYAACIRELREKAKTITRDTNNPFFRMLQIMESAGEN